MVDVIRGYPEVRRRSSSHPPIRPVILLSAVSFLEMLCYCTLALSIVAIIVSPIVHGYNFPWGKDPVARERDGTHGPDAFVYPETSAYKDTWQSDVSAILRNQGQQ